MPYTGACIPGEKLFVNTEGNYFPCERTSNYFIIGNITKGIDFTVVKKWMDKYFHSIVSNCNCCSARIACSSCYNTFLKGSQFVQPIDFCDNMCENLKKNLSVFITILEENPKWFDNFYKIVNKTIGDYSLGLL